MMPASLGSSSSSFISTFTSFESFFTANQHFAPSFWTTMHRKWAGLLVLIAPFFGLLTFTSVVHSGYTQCHSCWPRDQINENLE
jgi:hypothetical protein